MSVTKGEAAGWGAETICVKCANAGGH